MEIQANGFEGSVIKADHKAMSVFVRRVKSDTVFKIERAMWIRRDSLEGKEQHVTWAVASDISSENLQYTVTRKLPKKIKPADLALPKFEEKGDDNG